jgi:hypothetical protein
MLTSTGIRRWAHPILTTTGSRKQISPRVVRPEHPHMALGISACIATSAAILYPHAKNDFSAFSPGFCVMCIDVGDDKVASLRLDAAELVRMNNQLFEGGILNANHHDHAFAEC